MYVCVFQSPVSAPLRQHLHRDLLAIISCSAMSLWNYCRIQFHYYKFAHPLTHATIQRAVALPFSVRFSCAVSPRVACDCLYCFRFFHFGLIRRFPTLPHLRFTLVVSISCTEATLIGLQLYGNYALSSIMFVFALRIIVSSLRAAWVHVTVVSAHLDDGIYTQCYAKARCRRIAKVLVVIKITGICSN